MKNNATPFRFEISKRARLEVERSFEIEINMDASGDIKDARFRITVAEFRNTAWNLSGVIRAAADKGLIELVRTFNTEHEKRGSGVKARIVKAS